MKGRINRPLDPHYATFRAAASLPGCVSPLSISQMRPWFTPKCAAMSCWYIPAHRISHTCVASSKVSLDAIVGSFEGAATDRLTLSAPRGKTIGRILKITASQRRVALTGECYRTLRFLFYTRNR